MTVSGSYEYKEFVADGLGTPRTIGFELRTTDNLKVTADGVAQVLGTHFAITGAYPAQQIVPIAPYWADGVTIAYWRETPRKQEYKILPGIDLRSATLEGEIDRLGMQQQEQDEDIARTPRVPRGEAGPSLDSIAGNAGKMLVVVDDDGEAPRFGYAENDPAAAEAAALRGEAAAALTAADRAAVAADRSATGADRLTTEGYKNDAEAAASEAGTAAAAALAAGLIYATTGDGVTANPNDGDGWWLKTVDGLDYYTTQSSAAQDENLTLSSKEAVDEAVTESYKRRPVNGEIWNAITVFTKLPAMMRAVVDIQISKADAAVAFYGIGGLRLNADGAVHRIELWSFDAAYAPVEKVAQWNDTVYNKPALSNGRRLATHALTAQTAAGTSATVTFDWEALNGAIYNGVTTLAVPAAGLTTMSFVDAMDASFSPAVVKRTKAEYLPPAIALASRPDDMTFAEYVFDYRAKLYTKFDGSDFFNLGAVPATIDYPAGTSLTLYIDVTAVTGTDNQNLIFVKRQSDNASLLLMKLASSGRLDVFYSTDGGASVTQYVLPTLKMGDDARGLLAVALDFERGVIAWTVNGSPPQIIEDFDFTGAGLRIAMDSLTTVTSKRRFTIFQYAQTFGNLQLLTSKRRKVTHADVLRIEDFPTDRSKKVLIGADNWNKAIAGTFDYDTKNSCEVNELGEWQFTCLAADDTVYVSRRAEWSANMRYTGAGTRVLASCFMNWGSISPELLNWQIRMQLHGSSDRPNNYNGQSGQPCFRIGPEPGTGKLQLITRWMHEEGQNPSGQPAGSGFVEIDTTFEEYLCDGGDHFFDVRIVRGSIAQGGYLYLGIDGRAVVDEPWNIGYMDEDAQPWRRDYWKGGIYAAAGDAPIYGKVWGLALGGDGEPVDD